MPSIDKLLFGFTNALSNFRNFGLMDIFDIIIVAYVVYHLINWARETRALSLFKGFIVIVIFRLLFETLGINTTVWIIDNIFKNGLIALIILFQPEIRKALEELGRGKFVFSNSVTLGESNKEIADIIKSMSKQKIGALICIEQNVPLGEYEKTGTLLDAIVSGQLLRNIFEDKAPLHDGAVIIKENRIAAAGCILPVTNKEIGKELGTRHRAAVGLSEVTDAVIFIVSEETGKISMTQDGKLQRDLEFADVSQILQAIADKETPKKEVEKRDKKRWLLKR